MMRARPRRLAVASLLLACALVLPSGSVSAATVVRDRVAYNRLIGSHLLSLQWVSWEQFGRATVTDRKGTLHLSGSQRVNGEWLTLEGDIVSVETSTFRFRGTITTRVSYINDGDPCVRNGEFSFAIKGTRKYWRMQSMLNPCDQESTDYVDVYFARS